MSNKKILITAFEPFGSIRKENAGLSIMQELRENLPPENYVYLTLPVSIDAPEILRQCLGQVQPQAILSLGEDKVLWPNTVRLEPYAHDRDATGNPIAGLFVPRINSAFAQSVSPETKNSTSLAWHCNAVFRTALKWAECNSAIPVAFAHVAVAGNRASQTGKTLAILDKLQNWQPVT